MIDRTKLQAIQTAACAHIAHQLSMKQLPRIAQLRSPSRNRLALIYNGDARAFVLKLYIGRFARERASTENVASALAANVGIRSPAIVLADSVGDILGLPWALFEAVSPATTLESVLSESATPPDRLIFEYGALPGRFSQIGLTHFGELYPGAPRFYSWPEFLIYRLAKLFAPTIETEVVSPDLLRDSLELVERYRRSLGGCTPSLVHGDLVPRNVLVGVEIAGTPTIVCDFELAIAGCPGWEYVQIARSFAARFPQWAGIFGSIPCGHYLTDATRDNRGIRVLYDVVEAAEYWVWKADGGARLDVRNSALAVGAKVTEALRSK